MSTSIADLPILGISTGDTAPQIADAAPAKTVQRAFLVIQHADGRWQGIPDHAVPVSPLYATTVEDMAYAAHMVNQDIQANQIAALTTQYGMQLAQRLQQDAQNQALIQSLHI